MPHSEYENILAIDTAASVFSAALSTIDGQWYFEADAGTRHSQLTMEIIDYLFKKAGIRQEELSYTVCMKGPGSFTGLRIGFSVAKGLALSLGIPFYTIPSLDCMSFPYAMWPGLVLPVIDAKKNSWYFALYSRGKRLCKDMDAGAEEILEYIQSFTTEYGEKKPCHVLICGYDAQKFKDTLNQTQKFKNNLVFAVSLGKNSSAKELLAIAKLEKINNNKNWDINTGPEYIRKSDAELNLGKQQLKND